MLEMKLLETKTSEDKTVKAKKYQIGRYTVDVIDEVGRERDIWVKEDYREENYLPEIYISKDTFKRRKPEVRIQTTAYGSMNVEGIEKVIDGYKMAIEVAKIITREFL